MPGAPRPASQRANARPAPNAPSLPAVLTPSTPSGSALRALTGLRATGRRHLSGQVGLTRRDWRKLGDHRRAKRIPDTTRCAATSWACVGWVRRMSTKTHTSRPLTEPLIRYSGVSGAPSRVVDGFLGMTSLRGGYPTLGLPGKITVTAMPLRGIEDAQPCEFGRYFQLSAYVSPVLHPAGSEEKTTVGSDVPSAMDARAREAMTTARTIDVRNTRRVRPSHAYRQAMWHSRSLAHAGGLLPARQPGCHFDARERSLRSVPDRPE